MRDTRPAVVADAEETPGLGGRLWALVDPREVWVSFLLFATMYAAIVLSVEGAHWVKEMPALTFFAFSALFIGLLFSRLKVNQLLVHPVAIVVGLMMCAWLITEGAAGDTLVARMQDAAQRMHNFGVVIESNGINTDGLPFAAQIVLLTWFIGYLSAWAYYRHQNVWLAVVPPGIALAFNLAYTPGRFTFNLGLYLFCALLLITEGHRAGLRMRWVRAKVPEIEMQFARSGAPVWGFAAVILGIAFLAPVIGQSVPVALAWEQATGPWRTIERQFDRLFASVSSGNVAPLHSFGRAMPFKGAVNFGDNNPLAARLGLARDVVMYVKAEESGYWKAETYTEYTSGGWLNPQPVIKGVARDNLPGGIEEYKERKPYQQTIELVQPLDVIPVRGIPLFGAQPANGETSPPRRFVLDLTDPARNSGLPAEIQRVAQSVSDQLRRGTAIPTQPGLQRMLPGDLRVERALRRGAEIASLEVSRTEPFPPNYSSVRPASQTVRGQKFTVVSSVSKAPVDMLRSASGEYPGWVRDEYLQVPDVLPERVKALAREWVQGSGSAFDRALSIEGRLRDYQYNTNIPAPPRDQDGVDFFLFDLKRGYADYHASAMAVMLRTLGIPARVAAGYVSGEYDAEKEYYVVREVHAHAWVEAFFPSYGWIDFNPAPNWPTPPRIYDSDNAPPPDEDLSLPDDMPIDGDLTDTGDMDAGAALPQDQIDVTAVATPIAVAGLLALAVWLVARWLWTFGLRGLPAPVQTYEKMCRLATLGRFGPGMRETPAEYARALGSEFPEIGREIGQIALRYNASRYGRVELSGAERVQLLRAWIAVRKRLLGPALTGWLRRFRA